jgi:hypothetical protein
MPDNIVEGVLYISMEYGTAIHQCACGCGTRVVTPLTPTDWSLTYDGEEISLYPSVGNWSFPCRSHYWIRKNKIEWAPAWSDKMIKKGRQKDTTQKKFFFKRRKKE